MRPPHSSRKGDEELVSQSLTRKALRSIWQDRLTLLALCYLIVLTIIALLAPVITDVIMQVDPNEPVTRDKFTPPLTKGYILGADDIGRDQLARLLHAGGVSMGIGFFGTLVSLSIGVSLGMISGYHSGLVDDFLNWFVTTIDAIPALFLLILIASFISFSAESLILVFGFLGWPGIYRLIRGQTISLRARDFILAARCNEIAPG